MARKGSQPALYELIRSRSAPAQPTRALPPATIEAAPAPLGPVAALPTRVVRLPVGYVYAGIAVVLLAVVASYLYGVSVGDRVARERFAQQRVDEMQAAGRLPSADPLDAGRLPPSLRDSNPASGRDSGRGSDGGDPPSRQAPSGALGPAASGDPRQPGQNYFVVAHTAASSGQAMVDFCRANGLDAHLVPDDNDRLRLVIITPGFASGERRSQAVNDLEARIRAVGLRWKSAARGNRDFGDAYPKKHQPKGQP